MKHLSRSLVVAWLAAGALLVACGAKDASSSPAGTYEVVKDAALMEGLKAVASHDSPELGAAKIEETLKSLEMALVLKSDGTFSVKGNMGAKFEANGTWALVGKDLTVTATHENGKARSTPEVTKLVYEGDTIRMPKDPKSQPFELVLRRK